MIGDLKSEPILNRSIKDLSDKIFLQNITIETSTPTTIQTPEALRLIRWSNNSKRSQNNP